MESINIALPAISIELIEQVNTQQQILAESELAAVRKLREVYGPLAKQNGFIKIWDWDRYTNSGQHIAGSEGHLKEDGKRVRALLAVDDFTQENTTEFNGINTGTRLYVRDNDWIAIKRYGKWSQYQGSPSFWACGEIDDEYFREDLGRHGGIWYLTDEEVAGRYKLEAICEGLAESLKTLSEKLPERYSRLKAKTEAAQRLVAALSGGA